MAEPVQHDYEPFALDGNRLDEEWVRQPRLVFEAATRLAAAREAWERAKARRDVTLAEVDRNVRLCPSDYGVEKVTEKVVAAAVLLSKEARAAEREVIRAKHEVDIRQAYLDMLEHRKKALENLVHLHSLNYFADPAAPRAAREQVRQAKADAALGPMRRRRDDG